MIGVFLILTKDLTKDNGDGDGAMYRNQLTVEADNALEGKNSKTSFWHQGVKYTFLRRNVCHKQFFETDPSGYDGGFAVRSVSLEK